MNDLKEFKLEASGFIAHLTESISYGEDRAIETVLFSAAKGNVQGGDFKADFSAEVTLKWTMKKLTTFVKKITDKDGKDIPVNEDTINNLPLQDGNALQVAVEEIHEGLKKKQS